MFFIFDNSSPAPATLSNLKYWRTSTKYLLLGLMCSKRGVYQGAHCGCIPVFLKYVEVVTHFLHFGKHCLEPFIAAQVV